MLEVSLLKFHALKYIFLLNVGAFLSSRVKAFGLIIFILPFTYRHIYPFPLTNQSEGISEGIRSVSFKAY